MEVRQVKTIGEIERVSRSGWYFVEEPTFHIPCLLAVGRYSEADSELCGALAKVAHFRNVPKTISATDGGGVNPDNCIGTHATVDGPYGPVQYINMREFDWCPHCIEVLAHEITHAARAALIDRNVYMGPQDRACETFSYVFSSLFLGFLEQLEEGNGWSPVAKNNDTKKGKKK